MTVTKVKTDTFHSNSKQTFVKYEIGQLTGNGYFKCLFIKLLTHFYLDSSVIIVLPDLLSDLRGSGYD